MAFGQFRERNPGGKLGCAALVVVLLALLAAVLLVWLRGDYLRTPQALYEAARTASPSRSAVFYQRLGEQLPQIREYADLWAAESAMPSVDALRKLQDVISLRPQSPAAYEAHRFLARYYASLEAGEAVDEYRAALALHDTTALRVELARYLESQGDDSGAYAEYLRLLNKQPDAFEGVRRTGHDPLVVAKDLLAASYASDAVDVLRTNNDAAAWPLRAKALADLGRDEEAQAAYRKWLETSPSDPAAQSGLASVLAKLGRTDEALALYKTIDTPDSKLAQADLLADKQPDEALALYGASPYPVAWWNATAILEARHRLTETLPLYARAARSDAAFADDAAYRLFIVGGRTGDRSAQADGKALLDGQTLDWLALRAAGHPLTLNPAPPLAPAGEEILQKAQALDALGRGDLAEMELSIAASTRHEPEVQLAMAQALAARGQVAAAQGIAAAYVTTHSFAPLAFWQLSYPQPYSTTVQAAAKEFKVDPLLIWSVMRAESRFDPEALSYAGARGLMQVMPDTQEWIAEQLGEEIPPGAAFTPEASIRMGAWYLHYLLQQFGGDIELAVAAYNGGPASVQSWQKDPLVANRDDFLRFIGFGQTREYLERVALNYQVYKALNVAASPAVPTP